MGSSWALFFLLGLWWGPPRPLLASVYLCLIVLHGKEQLYQLPEPKLPAAHSSQRLQPWLASAVDFLEGKSCLGPEVAPKAPHAVPLSFLWVASDDMYPQLGVASFLTPGGGAPCNLLPPDLFCLLSRSTWYDNFYNYVVH